MKQRWTVLGIAVLNLVAAVFAVLVSTVIEVSADRGGGRLVNRFFDAGVNNASSMYDESGIQSSTNLIDQLGMACAAVMVLTGIVLLVIALRWPVRR